MRWLMWTLAAVVACGAHEEPEPDARAEVADRIGWRAAIAADVVTIATLPAEVVTEPAGTRHLSAGVEGRLVAWHVAPGDEVVEGQPLADLVSVALSSQEGVVAALRDRVEALARVLETRRQAREAGVVSEAEVRDASAALRQAEGELATALSSMAALRDTTVRSGSTWQWRAPAAGRVAEVRCGLDHLDPDRTCVVLVDPSMARLRIDVPQRYLSRLSEPVRAVFHDASDLPWAFEEVGRAPHVDARTRTRTLFLAATQDVPLVGSAGRADVLVGGAPEQVVVPPEALTLFDGRPHVFVRRGDRGEPVPVELIGRHGADHVVSGLEPGVEVAVRGVFLLKSLAMLDEEA